MPKEYADALAEFEREKASIAPLYPDLDNNWQEAVRRTSALKLNQLLRRTPEHEQAGAADEFAKTGKDVNPTVFARTARRSSLGFIVLVGHSDRLGAAVGRSRGRAAPDFGVSFSRSIGTLSFES